MASPTTYTNILRLTKPGTGSTIAWGDRLNENFDTIDKHLGSLTGTAGVPISAFDIVCSSGGLIYPADTDHATEARRTAIAIADGSDTTGGTVVAVKQGYIDLTASGLTADQPIYLSATAGAFTTTPAFYTDGSYQYLGRTLDIDKIWFDPLPRTFPTWLECDAPQQYKDGSNNPAGSFTATWDNTDKRAYQQISIASGEDIDLWFSFELPTNFLAIPNNSFAVFSCEGKVSNAATSIAIAEIIDTAGGSITSGMPSATTSTSVATISLQGSVFSTGTFTGGGKVRIRLRVTGGGSHTASITTLATLRVPCKFF